MKTRNQEVLLNKFIDLNNEKIDLNCPICKDILTQPVTLPCSHNFCKNCLETSIKVLCQQCPCCRKRFSHWYRQAIKTNQLVNKHLWKKIRENYGDLLVNEQKTNINYQRFALSELNHNRVELSQTGEIREEYLKVLEQFEKETDEKEAAEEKATKNLILNWYKKEFKIPKYPQGNINMLVAGPSHAYQSCIGNRSQATAGTSLISGRGSINKSSTSVITISSASSPSCSSSMSNNYNLLKSVAAVVSRGTEIIKQKVSQRIFNKKEVDQNFSSSPSLLYPTKSHKLSSSRCRSDSIESNDSLKSEVRDFKPIRAAPTTPKKLSGEILRIPSVRPDSGSSIADCSLCPGLSSLSPINRNLPGRRSAFSIVSNIAAVTSTPKEVKPRSISVKADPAKHGRKRKSSPSTASSQQTTEKTFVTVIHLPTNKKTKINSNEPIASRSKERSMNLITNGRITRSTSLNKLNGSASSHSDENEQNVLKQAVVDQEKLEKILEQERKDFEFAKKLQRKLNKAEQKQNRAEYGLRNTRGNTKINGLVGEKNFTKKNAKEKSDTTVKNGKRKTVTEKTPNLLVLRRSTRKRQ